MNNINPLDSDSITDAQATEKAPFFREGASYFFESQEMSQRLDLLRHLLEFSHQVILVSGEAGSGKTTLLKQLMSRAGETWKIGHIQGAPVLDARVMLRKITSAFGLNPNQLGQEALNPGLELLHSRLDALERNNVIPVLLIDDAHHLPQDSLRLLFNLAQPETQHAKLHLAMFAEPALAKLLETSSFSAFKQNFMQLFDAPLLAEKDIREYLQGQFPEAAAKLPALLSDMMVRRFYVESKGLPGRVNTIAEHSIDEMMEQERTEDYGQQRRYDGSEDELSGGGMGRYRWQLYALAGVLAIVTSIVAISSFTGKPEDTQQVTDMAVELPDTPDQSATKDDTLSEENNGSGPATGLTEDPLTPNLADQSSQEKSGAENTNESNQIAVNDSVDEIKTNTEVNLPLPEPQVANIPEIITKSDSTKGSAEGNHTSSVTAEKPIDSPPRIEETDKIKTPEPKKETKKTAPEKTSVSTVPEKKIQAAKADKPTGPIKVYRPENKIERPIRPATKPTQPSTPATQSSGNYVLQVLGTSDRASVQKFISQQNLGGKLSTYTTKRDGKNWYVVVYGPFSDRKKAVSAISSLPASIKAHKPWPRTLAGLRRE